jgi:general secretion pathway protein N
MTSGQARQLTRVLYGTVGALAALYLLLLAGFGRGVPSASPGETDPLPTLQLSETQVHLPGLDFYDDLASRPLFAEDRKPQPKVAETSEEPAPEVPPTAPLNIALTGIIHTPQAKIALVRDNSTGRALSLKERMPLPGDQGAWLVKAIEPRRVVFEDTGSQTETTVDLPIGTASAASAGGGNVPRSTMAPAAANAAVAGTNVEAAKAAAAGTAPEEDPVARRAAEIRRRIEERRAQLRRDAQQSAKE